MQMSDASHNMTYSEIGSFFWLTDADLNDSNPQGDFQKWLPAVDDSTYTFSGRSAIDLALQDILASREAKTAYLPAYLCDSMVQPFLDHGIGIRYYGVAFRDGKFVYETDTDHDCDIVLIMSYFGLSSENEQNALKALKNDKTIIIEDLTHSLLCKKACSEHSDYYVASLRKCLPVPTGGWIGKKDGKLRFKPYKNGETIIESKVRGMYEKYDYMTGKTDTKELFWKDQSDFEEYLEHVDHMLELDNTSRQVLRESDIQSIADRRKSNAKVLREALQDIDHEILHLPELDVSSDTPLFLPVFLRTELRNSLRKFLIDNNVYCPVHWPAVEGAPESVVDNELSLICDQRYNEQDMLAISALIHEWVFNNKERAL